MIEDKVYCMSSFLMYRTIIDKRKCFSKKYLPYYVLPRQERYSVCNANELFNALKNQMLYVTKNYKVALALSGGIDSAILAKLLPAGTMTYTFRCIPNCYESDQEIKRASEYARQCRLQNKIIDITWQDMQELAIPLMKHKGAPIHSIEVQIYKAAKQAKKDGIDVLIFGESADVLYGGMSKLLSRDWALEEFIERYSYVMPSQVLKEYYMIIEPYVSCTTNGIVDVHKFNSTIFYQEAINSYYNACATAEIACMMPFSNTILGEPLNYDLIRVGKNKYLVREVFERLYKDMEVPEKMPMPRPMQEWLKFWKGPTREEFLQEPIEFMTGDQKWLIWILEKFLNLCDEERNDE